MLVTSIGTVKDSVTKPFVRYAFFDCSSTLEITFLGALAIPFVRIIQTVSVAVANEIIIDTLLLIGAGELRLFARDITKDFVAPIIAVVLAIAPLRSSDTAAIVTFEF